MFDFDGPLFDGRKAAERALRETVAQFERRFSRPQMFLPTLPLYGPKRLIALLYPHLEHDDRECIRSFYQKVLHDAEREVGASDSVREALDSLAKAKFALTIYSARQSDDIMPLLRDLGLSSYFASVACSPDYVKPSGDYLRAVVQSSQANASEVLFVGDSDLDYLAARDAQVSYYHAAWTGEPNAYSAKNADLLLNTLEDLITILTDSQPLADVDSNQVRELFEAVEHRRFAFYAGAGISVPSGFGGWEQHYRPVLSRLSAGFLEVESDLPGVLQLLASNPVRAKRVFDAFRASFDVQETTPNSYHYALLRSNVQHIWTSNYDELFETANTVGGFGRRFIRNDADLLEDFGAEHLVIKMNGDFQAAHYREDLNWGLVLLQEQFDRAERDRPEIWRMFEDDYRQSSIIFVGMSFRDPVLRRIVAVARQKIPRTLYNHYLITKREAEPAARAKQTMFAENLRRSSIITIFQDSHQDVLKLIQRISLVAYRPIVGFSGDVGCGAQSQDFAQAVPEGMSMSAGDIGHVCWILGEELARRKLRVTSGCAPFVGIPAVEAAFSVNPNLARFYLRKQGGTAYRRTAPAIVVPGGDYASMRARFIPELSLLIAVGGKTHNGETSGTIQEVEMALKRKIPVIMIPAPGGDIASHYDTLVAQLEKAYEEEELCQAVKEINEEVSRVSVTELPTFARSRIPELVQKILTTLMGAKTNLHHTSLTREW